MQCKKCGNCCKGSMGPFVFPSDVIKISNTLGVNYNYFLKTYCVKNTLYIDHEKVEIYSICCNNNGCIFLTNNNLCGIYSTRPYQCINAPYGFLSQHNLWSHMKCLNQELLQKSNSAESDYIIFKELIDIGYKKFERSDINA